MNYKINFKSNQKLNDFCLNYAPWIIGITLVFLAIKNGAYHYITVDTLHNSEIAKQMLRGKEVYKDLFEVNHPMIIYIFWVALFIAEKIQALDGILAVKILTLTLCFASVFLTHNVMKLSKQYDNKTFKFFFIIIAFYISFFIPLHFSNYAQLGQKPQLFFILFMPYLHAYLVSDEQKKRHPLLMLLVGLFAGIGLCIKVYYFIIPLIIEMFRVVKNKNIRPSFCIENFAVLFVAIVFLLSIIFFTPEYITDVILVAKYFYGESAILGVIHYSWLGFLFMNLFCFIFIVPFFFNSFKKNEYDSLLKIAIFAALVSTFPQISKWQHTSLPLFSLIMLLTLLTITKIFQDFHKNFNKAKNFNSDIIKLLCALFTIISISSIVSNNISSYKDKKAQYYKRSHIDHVIKLSQEYSNKGGGYFLMPGYHPGLYSWSFGDFELDSYYFSTYVVDSIKRLNEQNKVNNFSAQKKLELLAIKEGAKNTMIKDFIKQKPALVIVNEGYYKIYKGGMAKVRFFAPNFDYISIFARDKRFNSEWKNYRLKEVLDLPHLDDSIRLSIYIRNDLS